MPYHQGLLSQRRQPDDPGGLLDNWRYYAGPHLSQGIDNLGDAAGALLNYVGPQADVQGMVQDAGDAAQAWGRGPHGPKYETDTWDQAVKTLKAKQGGEVVGALHHPAVGKIDVPWGRPGTGKSDGAGLSKLLKYHPDSVPKLPWMLEHMQVAERTPNRVILRSNRGRATVRLDWDKKEKTWLLTAFKP